MKEKRRLQRRHLIFYLRVFKQKTNELLGYLVDINSEGIMIISENQIKINTKIKVEMALPTETGDRKPFEFEAKSKWCKKDINSDFYDIGFHFVDINPENIEIIEELVNSFGFQN